MPADDDDDYSLPLVLPRLNETFKKDQHHIPSSYYTGMIFGTNCVVTPFFQNYTNDSKIEKKISNFRIFYTLTRYTHSS